MPRGIKINKPGRKGKEIITFVIVLLAVTLYFSATAAAEIYKWVDDKGEMHIIRAVLLSVFVDFHSKEGRRRM